jgi:HEAT repeat protein
MTVCRWFAAALLSSSALLSSPVWASPEQDALLSEMRLAESSRDRKAAAVALGKLGEAGALEPLREAYVRHEINAKTYDKVVRVLSDDPSAEYLQIAALEPVELAARAHAIENLGLLGKPESVEPLLTLWAGAASAYDPDAKPDKNTLAGLHKVHNFSKEIFEALGAIGSDAAVPFLLERASENEPCTFGGWETECPVQHRGGAYEALGDIGSKDALDTLIALLEDPDKAGDAPDNAKRGVQGRGKGRRLGAIKAIVQIHGPDVDASEAVLRAYPETDWLWSAVLGDIADVGPTAVPFLERAFESGPVSLMKRSFKPGGKIVRDHAEMLRGSRFVGWFAEAARDPTACGWCDRADEWTGSKVDRRQWGIDGLRVIGDPAGGPALWAAYEGTEEAKLQALAVRALGSCGSAEDLPRIEEIATTHAESRVASAARKARAEILKRK